MNARLIAASLIATAGLTAAPARAQPALPTPAFIAAAAGTDAFERRAGKIAERKAQNPDVKAFGEMMITDHTKTTAGLKRAIHKAGLPPPMPPMPNADQMMMLADLRATPRRDFDRKYIHDQVVVHQQALMVIQGYASGGDNPVIRQAAAQTAPIVQRHLDRAMTIEAGLH